MAKVRISFDCGCGFKTADVAEAGLHSDQTKHNLVVTGSITNKKEVKKL